MKSRNNNRNQPKLPAEAWRLLIEAEKPESKVRKAYEKAGFGGFSNSVLTLYFEDESLTKIAKGQIEPLKKKLPPELQPCHKIEFKTGKAPTQSALIRPEQALGANKASKNGNPLQSLNFAEFSIDKKGNELSQPVLESATRAESSCDDIYALLKRRIEMLVGSDGVTLTVDFNWRVRVGGTRGFRELLLPVFHPVFGIPYIPASSLKGAARAWARRINDARIQMLLGTLEGKTAVAAKVEFLDAFPTKSCLSVDVATPQWHWQSNRRVFYKPEPHPLLSMKQPRILVGLRPTSRGTMDDVQVVKDWLENAVKLGLGSRVSSGYGRALGQPAPSLYEQSYAFDLWTQGMFGSEPPSKQNKWTGTAEFRPTAVRGILRYWFRAFALSLYDATTCQTLEERIFGKLGQQGSIVINVPFNDISRSKVYRYTGKICLEASTQEELDLISKLLILASHLGGVGRGSRRPLHLLNNRMRGCHWIIDGNYLPLEYEKQQWQQLFQDLTTAFQAVHPSSKSYSSDPGDSKLRYQDVLDQNAQVWLVKSPGQSAPEKVKNWQSEGAQSSVRGKALTLFYNDVRFKGLNLDGQGNQNVGGTLEVPSFVWIKSVFAAEPYQVVTIFGVNHQERLYLARELNQLSNKNQAQLVFGKMS